MNLDQNDQDSVRLDTWLYSVRIFKTRSLAKEKCSKGHIHVNDQKAKPSQKIKEGCLVDVKKDQLWRNYKVLKVLNKRVSAKIAMECFEEKTDQKIIDQMKMIRKLRPYYRQKGLGRPTKKERRELDELRKFE